MANPHANGSKNLVQNTLSGEAFIEHQRKAGRASGAVQKRRKLMREIARDLLASALDSEDEIRAELEKRGIDNSEAAAVLFAQLQRARHGDTEAARFLRDTSGQKPVDNVAIGNLDDKPFETLDLTKLSDADLKALMSPDP